MPKRLPVPLKPAEIQALLLKAREEADGAKTPSKQMGAWRDFVMIQTGLLAGCRVSELCKLQVEDIDLPGAVLAIKEGKGKKDRNVPIGDRLAIILKSWIGERKTGWLFPGPKFKRLTTRAFQKRLAALGKRCGLLKSIHPHLTRHSFATSLLESGASIIELQELMGHASIKTTSVYLHVNVGRLKKVIDKL